MGTPLGPKYIPYTYMDPLGKSRKEILAFSLMDVVLQFLLGGDHRFNVNTL